MLRIQFDKPAKSERGRASAETGHASSVTTARIDLSCVANGGVGVSFLNQVDTWTLFDVTSGIDSSVSASHPMNTFDDLGSG